MQYQVDKHIDDLEIEKKLVFIVKIESAKRMNKLKDEIQNVKEDKKVLVKRSVNKHILPLYIYGFSLMLGR